MMSSSLDQQYHKLSAKFQERSLREQILILFSGLVIVVLMMYSFLLESVLDNSEKLQQNSRSADKEMTSFAGQVATLTEQLKIDQNVPVREKIDVLKRQIRNIDEQLEAQTDNLVPSNKMAGMLETVLAGSKNLKLIKLQSIAPVPVLLEQSKEGEKPKVGLYRHGITLAFEGKYFDIQRYLEKLESLQWQFYWKKFDYLVGDYPNANVELEIYTLSTNKAFIGI